MRRVWALLLFVLAAGLSRAQLLSEQPPEIIRGLEVTNRLGDAVPGDIYLRDAEGRETDIGSYFSDQRPVVLLLVYYDCPRLCGLMLNKMSEVVNGVSPQVGEDYKIVVVSFDHANTTAMADLHQTSFQAAYMRGLTKLGHESYRFHTTTAAEARRLADAVGFDYRFVPASGEFAHPSVLYVLTPDGRVSSYLSGLDYEPDQLKLALLDAGSSKIGKSLGDFFLHMCFSFDPTLGKYTVHAMTVMKIAGVLSIVLVGGLVLVLRVREVARRRGPRPVTLPSTSPSTLAHSG